MTHTYKLQSYYMDNWITIKQAGLQYLLGYLDAHRNEAPRLAYRVLRSDGKIVEEIEAYNEVSVGMVAGWPTAEQYEYAAKKALEKAEAIREANAKRRF